MNTVPQIISTKDFAYLSDMFEWNYNAFKQINHFIDEVEDEEVKELLERARNMHEDHLHFIIATLGKEEIDEECDCDSCDCEECEFQVDESKTDDEDDEDDEDYDDEEEDEDE